MNSQILTKTDMKKFWQQETLFEKKWKNEVLHHKMRSNTWQFPQKNLHEVESLLTKNKSYA